MIFNLVHRANTRPVYKWQRDVGHSLGFRVTVFIQNDLYDNEEVVKTCLYDRDTYGDEIAIWLTPDEKAGGPVTWLVSEKEKERMVKEAVDGYIRIFGEPPKVIGNYVLDSSLIRIIKEYCPSVVTVVAGCFEEGVKVFHGCNNSWYLFSEGMSWNPWYPSKGHSVRPASDEDDWSGVVAVPHLSRDLVFAYESRNDFFASHPANVQRGLGNDGLTHAYDFNLCDQYRMQEDFNDGFSYYQTHVGSNWLSHSINVIDPDEVTQQIYYETLKYLADLRDEGQVTSMTLSEFGEEYKKIMPIKKQSVALGKDILMGSGKQYYWVFDPSYRALVDIFQGGSIGDLRPYASKYDAFTGVDAPKGRYLMNSYPYLIQSQYRTGMKNHWFDGSRTTLLMEHGGETLDMCTFNTKVESITRTETSSTLTLAPVDVVFDDGLSLKVQTVYNFGADGNIGITRRITDMSDENESVKLTEYVKGCYGFTEYPEDMKGIGLYIDGELVHTYDYTTTEKVREGGRALSVTVPEITAELSLVSETVPDSVSIRDGHLFEPYYLMQINYTAKNDEEVKSWLQIKRTAE